MKIESIIKRKKGTTVELGDMTYFFNATETEPRHLCEVKVQAHIDRFLSIKEGFREAEGEAKELKKQEPKPVKTESENLVAEIISLDTLLEEAKADQAETAVEAEAPAAPVNAEQKPSEPAAPAETQQPAAGADIDRNALLAEAKVLKIKSAHLFGNERLVQAVAAAKANG